MSVVGAKSHGGADEDERPVLQGFAGAENSLGRQPSLSMKPPAPRSGSRRRFPRDGAGAGPSYSYQPSRLRTSLSDSALLNLLDRENDDGADESGSGENSTAWETSAGRAAGDGGAEAAADSAQSGSSAFSDGAAAPAPPGDVESLATSHDVLQRRHSDPEISLRPGERRFTAADLQDLCTQKLRNPSLQQGLHRQLLLNSLSRRFSAEEARLRRSQQRAAHRRPQPVKPLVDLGPSPNSSIWHLDGAARAPAQGPATSGDAGSRKVKKQAKEARRAKSEESAGGTGDSRSASPPTISALDGAVKKGFRERLFTLLDVIPSRNSANSRKTIADSPVNLADEVDKPAPDQASSPAKRSPAALHTPKLVRSRRVKPFSMRSSEDDVGLKGTAGRRRWSTFARRAGDWQFVLRRFSAGDLVGTARRRLDTGKQLALPRAGGDPKFVREGGGVDEPDGDKAAENRSPNVSSSRSSSSSSDQDGDGVRPRNADRAEQRLRPRGRPGPPIGEGASSCGAQ